MTKHSHCRKNDDSIGNIFRHIKWLRMLICVPQCWRPLRSLLVNQTKQCTFNRLLLHVLLLFFLTLTKEYKRAVSCYRKISKYTLSSSVLRYVDEAFIKQWWSISLNIPTLKNGTEFTLAHPRDHGVFESLHSAVCVGGGCHILHHPSLPHCSASTGHHLLLFSEVLSGSI